jgi:hypothetical protein
MPVGVEGDVIRSTVAGDRICVPSSRPPFSSIRQKRDRSAAVLNSPAWPATPSMRRAVGSWTTPRRKGTSAVFAQGHENGRHRSVGAVRAASNAGGRNIESFMPSGSNTCRLA